MNKTIKVFSPATVANVACGFDVMGFALEKPGDEVILELSNSNSVNITHIVGDNGKLPLDPSKNTAGVAVLKMLQALHSKQGINIKLHKKIGLGSGLGSSASSSVAAAFALNHILGEPFTREELLPFTMEAERIACGSAHADNVAPALIGGFVLIRSYEPLDVIKLSYPSELYCAVIHPDIVLRTEDSRKALPESITLKDAVKQWGNIAGLISGLHSTNFELISKSLQDVVAEPVRSSFIPGFYNIKNAALNAGALGSSISGSGPSVFALCINKEQAQMAGDNMKKACDDVGVSSNLYISPINSEGPKIID